MKNAVYPEQTDIFAYIIIVAPDIVLCNSFFDFSQEYSTVYILVANSIEYRCIFSSGRAHFLS